MAAKKKEDDGDKKNNSKNQLSSVLNDHKEEHLNYTERVYWKCSTGSLTLDAATGMVSPGLWRLTGNFNCGKTPTALEIIRNMFLEVPNSKAVWVIAEGRGLSEQNVERCGLKFVEKPEDWEVGTVFILRSNIYELFIKTLKTLILDNEEQIRYAFVVDSIDGLLLRDDSKKDVTDAQKVAGPQALTKKFMQTLSLRMFHHGHLLIFISQVTAEIKLDQYSRSPDRGGNFSGGNSALHASDIILNFSSPFAGDFILDSSSGKFNDGKTKPLGQEVRVEIGKALKEESKKMKLTYPIKFGRKPSGVWVEREIGDLLLAWGLVVKSGAWIKVGETILEKIRAIDPEFPETVQGAEKFYQLFETRPEVVTLLRNEFLPILSGKVK